MAYDRTAYFEKRAEIRSEKQAEASYQRNLARARTGEMAAAHQEGLAAQGLLNSPADSSPSSLSSGFRNTGAQQPQELSAPNPLASAESAQTEAPSAFTYDDAPDDARPMARGGRYRDGEKILVGEAGYPEVIDTKRKVVTPLYHAAPGFRNTGAMRGRSPLTAPEATVTGHLITERQHEGTNRAHVEAAKITAERNLEGHRVTAAGNVAAHRVSAEPNLIQANVIRDKADREHMTQFNAERKAEYEKILTDMNTNWPQTVAKIEATYRAQNGTDMPAEQRGKLLQSDAKTQIAYNRDMGTANHGALLAMGLPKEGEAVRPGQLIANGFAEQQDGSWGREATNKLSGSKYMEKYTPGAEGLRRSEEVIPVKRDQGPGMYREEGRWYAGRTSSPQNVPPKVMTIEKALDPKAVSNYNNRAEKYRLPRVDAELIAQNPAAAAWQLLTGINKMNTDIGNPYHRAMGNDQRHLDAPTYVLNDADTQKAIKGHADWLNPSTAPPTAPAGTQPASTPEEIVNEVTQNAAKVAAQPRYENNNWLTDIFRERSPGSEGALTVPPATAAPTEAPVAPETGGLGEAIAAPAAAPKLTVPNLANVEEPGHMGSVWTPPPKLTRPEIMPTMTPEVEEAAGLMGVPRYPKPTAPAPAIPADLATVGRYNERIGWTPQPQAQVEPERKLETIRPMAM